MHMIEYRCRAPFVARCLMMTTLIFFLLVPSAVWANSSIKLNKHIQDNYIGHWFGISKTRLGAFQLDVPVEIEIEKNKDGEFIFVYKDPLRGNIDPVSFNAEAGTVNLSYQSLFGWPVSVRGHLVNDGSSFEVVITGLGMTGAEQLQASLEKNSAVIANVSAPRITSSRGQEKIYQYVAPVKRSDAIEVSTLENSGINISLIQSLMTEILHQTGKAGGEKTDSILIMRHGKLVLEEYFWGQTADNPHIISSVTKSVLSLLVGIGWDQKAIDIDERVTAYFQDYKDSRWYQGNYPINIRHALSMTSGTDWNDEDGKETAPSLAMLHSKDAIGFVLDRVLIHRPGSVYHYDNGLPTLMGFLLARTTRQSIDDFAQKHLFGPLGITNYQWTMLPEGKPLAAGGLYLSSRDMIKIGQLVLQKGKWQGRQIISEDWIHKATTSQTPSNGYPYGFYWHLGGQQGAYINKPDIVMALGQGGQMIAIIPSEQLVIVITSSNWHHPFPKGIPFHYLSKYILPALAAANN